MSGPTIGGVPEAEWFAQQRADGFDVEALMLEDDHGFELRKAVDPEFIDGCTSEILRTWARDDLLAQAVAFQAQAPIPMTVVLSKESVSLEPING